jgi:uncharacterized membrane protein
MTLMSHHNGMNTRQRRLIRLGLLLAAAACAFFIGLSLRRNGSGWVGIATIVVAVLLVIAALYGPATTGIRRWLTGGHPSQDPYSTDRAAEELAVVVRHQWRQNQYTLADAAAVESQRASATPSGVYSIIEA